MLNNKQIFARKVKQNNQEFLVAVFSIKQILTFTKYTERLIVYFDENNQPQYNKEIQRKVDNPRVERIADFLIQDPDAIFPTNIVLSIPNVAIDTIEDIENENVAIMLNEKVFTEVSKTNGDVYLTIIDGQHRICGIERAIERTTTTISNYQRVIANSNSEELREQMANAQKCLNDLLNINLVVTFFIDPTLEFQAMVFSTINRTQKSVPQSLVYSLFGLTQGDSPQKTSLNTVLTLNGFESSPFYNRIKLYGGKYERGQSPPLTQATMVKSILDFISTNEREAEKDRFRLRKDLIINYNDDLPFRKYYAQNNDSFITDIMYCFYSAVRDTFMNNEQSFWNFSINNNKPQNILHTTAGYYALLNLLKDILAKEKEDEKRDKIETYSSYLRKARGLQFDNQQRYPFTTLSKTILYLDLSLHIWPPKDETDIRIGKLDEALKK